MENAWRYAKTSNTVLLPSRKKEGKVPLRMGRHSDKRLAIGETVYRTDKDEIAKYLLKHNDVLFNRTNSPELVGQDRDLQAKYPAIFALLDSIHRK